MKTGYLSTALACVIFSASLRAQTFKIDQSSPSPPGPQKPANTTPKAQQKSNEERSLGWGSNINNARLARSAEQALKSGNYAAALDFAQRAAQAAPGDSHLWFLTGYAARLSGKLALSIDYYNRGLKVEPSSLDGMSGLAQAYAASRQTSMAQEILTRILSIDPRRAGDAQLLGEIQLRGGNYQDAVDTLNKAEQLQATPRSELLLASGYEHLSQPERANHFLQLAQQHAPDDPEVARSFGAFYREQGNYKAALNSLLSIANPSPEVTGEIAYTYQLSGQPEESAKYYIKAANQRPGDVNLQLSAAQGEVSAGSIEKAQPFLDRARQLEPDHYRLHALLGEIDRLNGNTEDAAKEYSSALAHLPADAPEGALYPIQLRLNLAELEKSLGNQEASDRDLKSAGGQIAALDVRGASRPEFLRLRATIKMSSGDFDGAQSDLKEALSINDKDPNNLQLSGDLLVKMGRTEDAIVLYKKVLAVDQNNRLALTALGFASRTVGRDQDAEDYFKRLAAAEPKLFVPYLALGDLYVSRRNFTEAEGSYRKAYELSPKNSQIIAGAMNAAIEGKQFPLAGVWLDRATPAMRQDAQIMREQERYLTWTGKYQESADVGRAVIQKLPHDRDVVVYLGYDLLHLEKYDELGELTSRYVDVLPKEPDIPLLAGYVQKHAGNLEEAKNDFSKTLELDPNVATAYVNRGYVEHDLREAAAARSDFENALRLEPENGEAHLGLAYASLDLHQAATALKQVELAQQEMGDSMPIHLVRGTADGDLGKLKEAVKEYRIALTFAPNDPNLHSALADLLYSQRLYNEAIAEFNTAAKLSPNDPIVYAGLARCYAQLHDRDATMQNVELAEKTASEKPEKLSSIYLSTGQALDLLGDRTAAMERFSKALDTSNHDSLTVRLAIANLMVSQDQFDDARRQVALGLMEARVGQADPPTGRQWAQAADVFLNIHDYQLAEDYYSRALAAGAPVGTARLGLANAYLALGDTTRAQAQVASINDPDALDSAEYYLTKANVFRQRHQNVQALTAFAQAANAAGQDETADRELLAAAGDEGFQVNSRLSLLSDFSVQPVFEDTTVYPLDARLDVANPLPGKQALLPEPRSSLETQWTTAYHLHFADLPGAGGFFQIRNSRGQISLPSADTIINRDTTDYTFNFGLNPTVHFGRNVITFNSGVQETVRRDSSDPTDMNQNLFRQFVYMNTSSFFNAISVSGYAIRETGPFTERDLHSRDLAGALNFRVGAPWAKTALITGWGARDEQFRPLVREFYYTSVYLGVEHRFNQKFLLRAVAEDLRAWRVQDLQYAVSQALRPAGSILYSPTRNWNLQATVAYSRNMSFHAYDAVQTGFAASYALPLRREYKSEAGDMVIRYPIRFSAGYQQESFFNFPGSGSEKFRPYISITIF